MFRESAATPKSASVLARIGKLLDTYDMAGCILFRPYKASAHEDILQPLNDDLRRERTVLAQKFDSSAGDHDSAPEVGQGVKV